MQTPLNASASTAGALFSNSTFEVPQYQREYSWLDEQVQEFWKDLQGSLGADTYFLGLIILTDEEKRKHVVDGQQRLITLSLLAAALYHEAIARGRTALADRISANFLKSIDYETDHIEPRIRLSDPVDDETFQYILEQGRSPSKMFGQESVSARIVDSYNYIQDSLQKDLKQDSFKRLGVWADFLNYRVYFAVFVHPDSSSAYQVFEVINTRGKELTTADLLKNHLLSQTPAAQRQSMYERWKAVADQFDTDGSNNFVQYIRHVVTVQDGHVLPKDLFSFLAGRLRNQKRPPHSPDELMDILQRDLSLYLQMIDPSLGGPADSEMLAVFAALNSLGVIAVRPILIATFSTPNAIDGMRYVLRLVVRRIVLGSLGTGNVERRFGEAARHVREEGTWEVLRSDLRDLDPTIDDFVDQIRRRSFNKSVLTFLRRSVVQQTMTPDVVGSLHFICPRQADDWPGMDEEARAYWSSTLGNSFLSTIARRPANTSTWPAFKERMLDTAVEGEFVGVLEEAETWDAEAIAHVGDVIADVAADVWYE